MKVFAGLCIIAAVSACGIAHAQDNSLCTYLDGGGRMHVVTGSNRVPEEFRSGAKCRESTSRPQPVRNEPRSDTPPSLEMLKRELQQGLDQADGSAPPAGIPADNLAAPSAIELKGALRNETVTSNLGLMHLRWPRSAELMFGRTPLRALSESSVAVSRALRKPGFPPKLQNLSQVWEIVFMDGEPPAHQVPAELQRLCHPAWMTPPGNIYVVSQRIAGVCPGQKDQAKFEQSAADIMLARALVHELGHVVEYNLLGGKMGTDTVRAEGFASWFESYAADMTSVVPKGSTKAYYLKLAQQSMQRSPNATSFNGTAEDYGRASMVFHAIVARRGVAGLAKVYEVLSRQEINFAEAVKQALGWDDTTLNREVSRVLAGEG